MAASEITTLIDKDSAAIFPPAMFLTLSKPHSCTSLIFLNNCSRKVKSYRNCRTVESVKETQGPNKDVPEIRLKEKLRTKIHPASSAIMLFLNSSTNQKMNQAQ